jgi:hypothetical protein
MSNPLLKPDDPRFQPRPLTKADGSNPFAEGEAVLEAEAAGSKAGPDRVGSAFTAPAATDERPFRVQYELTAPHRGGLLLVMSVISMLGAILGAFVMYLGWVLPLLALVPALTVIFLAVEDLKMMKLGGRDPAGRAATIAALVISSLLALGLCTMIGIYIYLGFNLLPEGMLG